MADPDETVAGLRTETPVDPAEAARGAPRLSSEDYPSVAGQVQFRCGDREGGGVIHDISLTGAHIAKTTVRIPPGEEVELFFLMGAATPRRIKALATVVRQTASGFAVRFLRIERQLERLVLAATSESGPR